MNRGDHSEFLSPIYIGDMKRSIVAMMLIGWIGCGCDGVFGKTESSSDLGDMEERFSIREPAGRLVDTALDSAFSSGRTQVPEVTAAQLREQRRHQLLSLELERSVPVEQECRLDVLRDRDGAFSPGVVSGLKALERAAELTNRLYQRQRHPTFEVFEKQVFETGTDVEQGVFRRNNGPWCVWVDDPLCNVIASAPAPAPRRVFWPHGVGDGDMGAFQQAINGAELLSPFTLVRYGDGGRLRAVSYVDDVRFEKLLRSLGQAMETAAELMDDPHWRRYLELRAEELLKPSFDNFAASSGEWIKMNGALQVAVGLFNDQMDPYGVKRGFEFVFGERLQDDMSMIASIVESADVRRREFAVDGQSAADDVEKNGVATSGVSPRGKLNAHYDSVVSIEPVHLCLVGGALRDLASERAVITIEEPGRLKAKKHYVVKQRLAQKWRTREQLQELVTLSEPLRDSLVTFAAFTQNVYQRLLAPSLAFSLDSVVETGSRTRRISSMLGQRRHVWRGLQLEAFILWHLHREYVDGKIDDAMYQQRVVSFWREQMVRLTGDKGGDADGAVSHRVARILLEYFLRKKGLFVQETSSGASLVIMNTDKGFADAIASFYTDVMSLVRGDDPKTADVWWSRYDGMSTTGNDGVDLVVTKVVDDALRALAPKDSVPRRLFSYTRLSN